MKRALAAAAIFAALALPATAATVSKSYSYFSVGGTTLDQLEAELSLRGPQVNNTGRRHPGATQMQFDTKIDYVEKNGYCHVKKARVAVTAKVILPRWSRRSSADRAMRTVWDTLASDIKRHEESHVVIARNHARELEQALAALSRQKSCATLAKKAKAVSAKILDKHDRAQERFDRIEAINFERRMLRQLNYRMERIESGKLSD
jgi:predicted secreted Zn-dependent protease